MLTPLSLKRHYALIIFAFVLTEAMLMLFVDQPLSLYLRTVDSSNHDLIDFFRGYTDFGLSAWYLWPSGIGALICFSLAQWRQIPSARREKLRRAAWMLAFFFVGVALAGIVTDMLKALIGRARPVLLDREGFYGFHPFATQNNYKSFPSGHSTTAFAVAAALIALFPRWRYWFVAFALAIGLSRIMVNAHYLSDVPAGAVVGILTVWAVRTLFERRGKAMKKHGIFPIDNQPRNR